MTDYEFYSLMNRIYSSCKINEAKGYARPPFASPTEINFPPIPQTGHVSSDDNSYWSNFCKYYH